MNIHFLQRPDRSSLELAIFLVFLFGNLACNSSGTGELAAPSGPNATPVPSQVITDTPIPSPTTHPSLVILLAPDGSDTEDVISLQAVLTELAEQDELRFETYSDLATINLDPDVRIVVVVSPDPGILNLAAANPETQFLAIGITGLQAAQNISVIGSGGDRPDQQGFLAGYLAAVITQDWRVGVITPIDTPAGRASRNGFGNGVIFYCGLCRSAYPPFYQYPVFAELPTAASQMDQQAAVELMTGNAVKTVYVFPGAEDDVLLEHLAQAGVNVIGGIIPPGQVKNRWVASVRVDNSVAVRKIWPRLIRGEQGINLEMPLVITDQNTSLFSLGRQHLVEKILAEMLAGFIDTGVDPVTGEPH